MLLLFSALDLWLFKHFRLKRKLKSFSAWFATPSQTKPLSIGNIGCADVGHTEKRSNFCWFEAWTERRSKSFRWQSDRILDNVQKWGCPSFPVLLARVLLPDGGIRALAALCRLQDRQSAKKPQTTPKPLLSTPRHIAKSQIHLKNQLGSPSGDSSICQIATPQNQLLWT